jgi:hypothetical protein
MTQYEEAKQRWINDIKLFQRTQGTPESSDIELSDEFDKISKRRRKTAEVLAANAHAMTVIQKLARGS